MNSLGETPDWQQKLKEDIGENPARFLDRRIPNPPPRNSMFRARLEGIDRLEVVYAWKAAERKLQRGLDEDALPEGATLDDINLKQHDIEPGRQHVLRLLDDRKEWLQAHGERPREYDGMWPSEVPERYRAADRTVPPKNAYWVKRDRSGEIVERVPWSERPTSISTGRSVDSLSSSPAVATDGGDAQ